MILILAVTLSAVVFAMLAALGVAAHARRNDKENADAITRKALVFAGTMTGIFVFSMLGFGVYETSTNLPHDEYSFFVITVFIVLLFSAALYVLFTRRDQVVNSLND